MAVNSINMRLRLRLVHTFSNVHSSFKIITMTPERPNPTNNPGHHLLLNKYYWKNTTEGGGGEIGLKREGQSSKKYLHRFGKAP